MNCLKTLCNNVITRTTIKNVNAVPSCGMKYFPPPKNYDHIQIPEKYKLRVLEKVPQYPPGIRPPRMQKRLMLMRGPELIHNTFIHKQYGIVAKSGGRMRYEHFEMIRLGLVRKLNPKTMFAIWRIDPPWQPITKKGQGQRMGGGKGAIDHYVTPVKAERIILEVAGKCEFAEVRQMLESVACRLPFAALAMSQEMLDKQAKKEKMIEENNENQYTLKFVFENNLGGCHKWLSPVDFKWFGKYR